MQGAALCCVLLFPVVCLATLPDDIGGNTASGSGQNYFPLPPLELPNEKGEQIDIKSYRGKIVLVNFWATWCPPCIEEFPSMQRLKAASEENLEILAINVSEESDQVFGFTGLLDISIDFPVLYDSDTQLSKAWGVRALPTTIVVDRYGRGVYRVIGGRQWDSEKIRQKLQGLFN